MDQSSIKKAPFRIGNGRPIYTLRHWYFARGSRADDAVEDVHHAVEVVARVPRIVFFAVGENFERRTCRRSDDSITAP